MSLDMSPITYHAIGIAMIGFAFLFGLFGPREFRGWPAGISEPWARWIALILIALFWPAFAMGYALCILVTFGFWLRRAMPWERIMQAYAAIGLVVMYGFIGWWLVFRALPALSHWYGLI